MAIGDVVSDILSIGAVTDFQPAAGVGIMISALLSDGAANTRIAFYDGANLLNFITTDIRPLTRDIKLFINNTNYLRFSTAGGAILEAYSGIQIK